MQHDRPGGVPEGEADVVGGKHQHPGGELLTEGDHHALDLVVVLARGRLVQQQHGGVAGQRGRHGGAKPLPARERLRRPGEQRGDRQRRRSGRCACGDRLRIQPVLSGAIGQLVGDGGTEQGEVGILRNRDRLGVDGTAGQATAQQPQERGLAGAVAPQQRHPLPGLQGEADPIERVALGAVVAKPQPGGAQQHGAGLMRRRRRQRDVRRGQRQRRDAIGEIEQPRHGEPEATDQGEQVAARGEVIGRSVRHQPPVLHDDQPGGDLQGGLQAMFDHDHRHARRGQPGQLLQEGRSAAGIKLSEGLIKQQQLCAGRQRSPGHQPLGLPAGQRGGVAVGRHRQPHRLQQPGDGGVHVRGRSRGGLHGKDQLIPHRAADQLIARLLGDKARQAHPPGRVCLRRIDAVQADAAGDIPLTVPLEQPGDQAQQGGLSAAGRTGQQHHLARLHDQVDVLHRPVSGGRVAIADLFQGQ